MDRVHAELLAPLLVMELRQEAGRQPFAVALAPVRWGAAPVASFGRLPIGAEQG
ncbi:MAG: hypothetical protein U0031_03545 [Thermomicrobiales bacterium]